MSKRNREIRMSLEAQALKELRVISGLSLRKLADQMGYSFTRVHQMETGRENISESYIKAFLQATGFSWDEWLQKTRSKDEFSNLRNECHQLIDSINPHKLELIVGLLSNL